MQRRVLVRSPQHPALAGVVDLVWVGTGAAPATGHERIVPSGQLHLAWRACGTPLRLGLDGTQVERCGVLGGPRTTAHVHDTPGRTRSVGAVVAAGAVPRLIGDRARVLRDHHVGLDLIWGADARALQAALGDATDADALAMVEATLVRRLRPAPAMPGLAQALRLLERGASIAAVGRTIGYAPRTLRAWFDDVVGLSPVGWARTRRLRRALAHAHAAPTTSWADVATAAGYYDQPHLCRELRVVADMSPAQWRAAVGAEPHHVPIPAGAAVLSKPRRGGNR